VPFAAEYSSVSCCSDSKKRDRGRPIFQEIKDPIEKSALAYTFIPTDMKAFCPCDVVQNDGKLPVTRDQGYVRRTTALSGTIAPFVSTF
jgi:protein tyrosine phosphatase (PTP) superfamily phosphohydrolase (DUF442 family)